MARKSFTISSCYCTQCGNMVTVSRPMAKQREKGHLKRIYCVNCKKEINHYEVRAFDSDFSYAEFMEEIKNGKFEEVK